MDWLRRKSVLLSAFLALLALWTFWPALHNGFVILDDFDFVTRNPHVAGGLTWANIKWAFTSTELSNWHPLTWLSYAADCQFFGLNPARHHLTNVFLHAANAALVFLVLKKMTGGLWRSFFVAALFALHPLRVESVAWIAERKDVLSAFFWMLTMLAYAEHAKHDERQAAQAELARVSILSRITRHASGFYWLALFFFACGLMSKPMLVTVPFALLLLDFWPLNRAPDLVEHGGPLEASNAKFKIFGTLILEKIPFFTLAAAASAVTIVAQKNAGAFESAAGLTPAARLENAAVSYARYLGKIFWPQHLAVGYPYPGRWPAVMVWTSCCLLLCVSIFAAAQWRRHPYLIVGWLWFAGTLAPVIGIVQVGAQAMADRYTYAPAIGIFIMLAWGANDLLENVPGRKSILTAATGMALVACIFITRRQISFWKNSESLLAHSIAAAPGNYFAHYWLGVTLADGGRMADGIAEIREALRIRPNADVRNGFGLFLEKHGRLDAAIAEFQDAIKREPDYVEAHYNLGYACFLQGRADDAIAQYRDAIRLDENYFAAHNDLGAALARKGELDAAVAEFQKAARLQPRSADAHYNLGNAFVREGRLDEAIAEFQKSLRLKPDAPDVRNNLGVTLVRRGRLDEAIEEFQQAVRLKPGFADAQRNLAAALAFQKRKK